jgi:peptidoglycan-N-acetylglucosamine deacetylase
MYNISTRQLLLIKLVIGLISTSIYASDPNLPAPEKNLIKPSVLLTFDDHFVNEWVAAIPIFQRYNAKATFFVTGFDKLTKEQIDGLKKLKAAGHSIGCHSLRHKKALEYVKEFSLEQYWRDDIEPAIKLMSDNGLPPSCFAYPSSQNDKQTDQMLLKYFSHLRSGVSFSKADAIFVPSDQIKNKGCLYGTSIDSDNKNMTLEYICYYGQGEN